jgi:hypothetical protein
VVKPPVPVGRPINQEERGWIMTMLANLPAEFDVYKEQLDGLRFETTCSCGCGTLDLAVAGSAPRGPHRSAVISDGLADYDDDCAVKLNEAILFIKDGALSSLEFVRYGEFSGMTRPVRVYLRDYADSDKRTVQSSLKDKPNAP